VSRSSSGHHAAGVRDGNVIHYCPAVGVMELCAGEALGRCQVRKFLAPNVARVCIQVRHVELDVRGFFIVMNADGGCFFCHASSVEWGTDIFRSIRGRVQILSLGNVPG